MGELSLCPCVALGHPQGGPVPTVVPRVGVGTQTHLPVEKTVEQSHQEALGRTRRAIFTQRKGLDPSVLIFSLAFPPPTPLTHHKAEEIRARFSRPNPCALSQVLGAPSPKKGQNSPSQGLLVGFGGAHGDFPCPSHLVGAEHQLKVEAGVHTHVPGEEGKHHVVHPKEGDEQQGGLGQPPVESERGLGAPAAP